MKIITNIKEESENVKYYITIFDEHFMENLLTIYGNEKAYSIILEGKKKYDGKFHIITRYKNLICEFNFNPNRGIIMKTYDFNYTKINSEDSFLVFLENNGLSKHLVAIQDIIKNPSKESYINMIKPEDYFFDKFQQSGE